MGAVSEVRDYSEAGTGSREENASKQDFGVSVLIQSEPKLCCPFFS
jgi:hypothetical protein